MSDLTLTRIRFSNGKWEGRIDGAKDTGVKPDLRVTLMDQDIDGVEISEGETGKQWKVVITVPSRAIADGVHSILIFDASQDTKLGEFTLIGGEPATDGLLSEVSLLRAELDMLKRAFRRHCLETG